jgi:16S rRNA (cytosine967-C5)-methyltransferase
VTELVYGTLTYELSLDKYLARFLSQPLQRLDPAVLGILRLGLFQVYYTAVPDHAAVSESVALTKSCGRSGLSGLVNGVLRRILRESPEPDPGDPTNTVSYLSLKYSHPEWLVRRWVKAYGSEAAERIMAANNLPPPVTLRVNTLKTSVPDAIAELRNRGFAPVPGAVAPDAVELGHGSGIFTDPFFRGGKATVQSQASQLVGLLASPAAGATVYDLAAAPGGKTTYMAELMGDRGRILAVDIYPSRVELIRANCARLGIHSVETKVSPLEELEATFPPADLVLLDAPCSGLGALRRNPDERAKKQESDIAAMADKQAALLEAASRLVARGGVLIYSVCSPEYEEGPRIVREFLTGHSDFGPAPASALPSRIPAGIRENYIPDTGGVSLWPSFPELEGFFLARIVHRG